MQKRVIIVGASSGIGRKMAELYAERGWLIGITGRRKELLEEIRKQYPNNIHTGCFDVTCDENIPQLQSLVAQMGGLDLLVISAGTGEPSKELSWEIDERTIKTNVQGFTEIANWGFNYFAGIGQGQMAVISSIGAIRGGSWAPAYNASKAFQSHYFNGLSVKASKMKKNITMTCVEPGFVATKMAKSHKLFWVVPVEKAARQIMRAIDNKKRKAYISKRWWLIAQILRFMPHWLYKKIA
jgi:short-subunit dehydrogenase